MFRYFQHGWMALILLAVPLPAYAAELLQPLPDATVFDWDVQVVVKGKKGESVQLELDGKKLMATPVSAADGTVYWHAVEAISRDGQHELRVFGASSTSYTFLAGDMLTSGPDGWKENPFHGQDRSAGCLISSCHTDQTEADPDAVAEVCIKCHKYRAEFSHAPAAKGLCFRCHKQNTSGLWGLLGSPNEQCRYCHEEPFGKMARAAYIHGPVNLGNCTLCHDPHANANQMLTRRGSNGTCVFCHAGYDTAPHLIGGFYASSIGKRSTGHPVADFADPLDPQMSLRCASCHSPHEAKNQMQFRYGKTQMLQLCRACHKGKF